MDTCLTGLILGVSREDEIVVVPGEASPDDLADPQVYCIECGGAGGVELNNYDHHNTPRDLPCACKQAFAVKGGTAGLSKLVEYVALLDVGGPQALKPLSAIPPGQESAVSLSNVFSGMRLAVRDTKEQFLRGIELLRRVLDLGLDPFGPMPELPEWAHYISAKRQEWARKDRSRRKLGSSQRKAASRLAMFAQILSEPWELCTSSAARWPLHST